MRLFISSLNIPIGYSTPSFPSLFWPLGPTRSAYQVALLYYTIDIWKFTVWWTLILFGGLYTIVGIIAAASSLLNKSRHNLNIGGVEIMMSFSIVFFYLIIGLTRGFCSGAVVGIVVAAIYNAGSLTMSTWIPMTWAIAQVLYDIASSYSTTSIIL
ncbi:uncharacterized protein SPAPADRAFT_141055 [Spathaspora passalidarum NRRL Y-27907]|uniref:Uncharacterized protein n=1 Tax=Spathaspora passalidarum (strain NRRL Y-27907 / 11-Y1) TaxID=619300 RepID=G3AQZ0_SPAPN|nr:uncharacterized protein SPAPADRAFT_141055 [Spathaspora passalidarum NRRL Y-27907]EGW31651.1 hypothetical protein SPAPADRAFT_141055 [Spathaspora passalidarum NRRL Y-27907]